VVEGWDLRQWLGSRDERGWCLPRPPSLVSGIAMTSVFEIGYFDEKTDYCCKETGMLFLANVVKETGVCSGISDQDRGQALTSLTLARRGVLRYHVCQG
jgi:hypothetical protein